MLISRRKYHSCISSNVILSKVLSVGLVGDLTLDGDGHVVSTGGWGKCFSMLFSTASRSCLRDMLHPESLLSSSLRLRYGSCCCFDRVWRRASTVRDKLRRVEQEAPPPVARVDLSDPELSLRGLFLEASLFFRGLLPASFGATWGFFFTHGRSPIRSSNPCASLGSYGKRGTQSYPTCISVSVEGAYNMI